MGQSVSVIVEGGKATAAPPLGPALGPLGVPINKVIEEINKKTADLKGMQVPVKVTVEDDKSFEIEIGTPPTSALIKKEAGIERGAGDNGKHYVGKITLDQAKKITKTKFGSDEEQYLNQILGTAKNMGIYIGSEDVQIVKEEKKKVEKVEKAPAAGKK